MYELSFLNPLYHCLRVADLAAAAYTSNLLSY